MHDASIKLKLYPNPVQNELHITICEPEAMVNIFDANAKLCMRSNLTSNQLDVGNLTGGLYVISVIDNNTVHVEKFIKLQYYKLDFFIHRSPGADLGSIEPHFPVKVN